MRYRQTLTLACCLLAFAPAAKRLHAQPAALQPPLPPQPPAAQPVAQVVHVALAPFRPLRAEAATLWIGEGIQQALIADLAGVPSLRLYPLSPDQAEDAKAFAAARQLAAQVVIVGTFQTSPDEVRATGRVLLASGQSIGVMSSRAPLREVFRLQDDLARQVRHLLVDPTPPAAPNSADPAAADSPPPAAPVPFEGSALQRALAEEDAGRRPSSPPPGDPRPGTITENPGGWGTPGFSGGSWGYGYPGYWGYTPIYRPPTRLPGSGSGGGGADPGGGGSTGASPSPSPAPPPSHPPLIYPGTTPPPSMPPGTGPR